MQEEDISNISCDETASYEEPELQTDGKADSHVDLRSRIHLKIKQHADLLSKLAHSLSDDILETSLEAARAQENLDYLQNSSSENLLSCSRNKDEPENDPSEDGRSDIQQNLVKHLKDEYEDLSGMLIRMKVTMGDIMSSLGQRDLSPKIKQSSIVLDPEMDRICKSCEGPMTSGPDDCKSKEKKEENSSMTQTQEDGQIQEAAVENDERQTVVFPAEMTPSEDDSWQATNSSKTPNMPESNLGILQQKQDFALPPVERSFSVDISIQSHGPGSKIESQHLSLPKWGKDYPGIVILHNSLKSCADSKSEMILKSSLTDLQKDTALEDYGDKGFLYGIGNEHMHTRFASSPLSDKNIQKCFKKCGRSVATLDCTSCKTLHLKNHPKREKKRTGIQKVTRCPNIMSRSAASQFDGNGIPAPIVYPVTRKYHPELLKNDKKNGFITDNGDKNTDPKPLWNALFPNISSKNQNIAKDLNIGDFKLISSQEPQILFAVKKPVFQDDLAKPHESIRQNQKVENSNTSASKHTNNNNQKVMDQKSRNRSVSSPGANITDPRPIKGQQRKQAPVKKSKALLTQSDQPDNKKRPSNLDLAIEIPPQCPADGDLIDAKTVGHIRKSDSVKKFSIALQTEDHLSRNARVTQSGEPLGGSCCNRSRSPSSTSYSCDEYCQILPTRTRWGLTQIDEYQDGTRQYKVMSDHSSENPVKNKVEFIITVPHKEDDILPGFV